MTSHDSISQDNNNNHNPTDPRTGISVDNSDDQNTTSRDITDDPIIPILSLLTTEYQQLSRQQRQMEEWIQRLQGEEKALQQALEQATVVPPPKPQHQQALERLERALFQDDSDDDTSDTDDDAVHKIKTL